MRKIYNQAEKLLLKDKFNNTAQINILRAELENFLSEYIVFDKDQYQLNADLSDNLVLTMQVVVKNYKQFKTSDSDM